MAIARKRTTDESRAAEANGEAGIPFEVRVVVVRHASAPPGYSDEDVEVTKMDGEMRHGDFAWWGRHGDRTPDGLVAEEDGDACGDHLEYERVYAHREEAYRQTFDKVVD